MTAVAVGVTAGFAAVALVSLRGADRPSDPTSDRTGRSGESTLSTRPGGDTADTARDPTSDRLVVLPPRAPTDRGAQPSRPLSAPAVAPSSVTGDVVVTGRLDFGLSKPVALTPVVLDSDGVVHEVDLADGSITSTTAVPVEGEAPVYMFADGGDLTVVAYDDVPGFVYTLDRTVTVIPAGDQPSGLLHQGPSPDTVWAVERTTSPGVSANLVGIGDRADGSVLRRDDAVLLGGDGDGRLVIEASGGVYLTGVEGTPRLTAGQLLALGPTDLLARECGEACRIVRRDRTTGEPTAIDHPAFERAPGMFGRFGIGGGSMSPDGEVVLVQRCEAALVWSVVDLANGAVVDAPAPSAFVPIVWSDDSRFAAFVSEERLRIYDRDAARIVTLDGLDRLRTMAPHAVDRPDVVGPPAPIPF